MLKKSICVLLVVAMMFSLCGCSDLLAAVGILAVIMTSDDRADKDEIFVFVRDHESQLLSAIEKDDFTEFENQGFIKDIDADEDAVDFSCGGAGMGSATAYVGFYYTPSHDMTAVWCAPYSEASLSPSGNGFLWQEPDSDNRYYTEQICGCFYYYEASF